MLGYVLEQRIRVSAAENVVGDVAKGIEPTLSSVCLLIQPRVGDGDSRLRGQHDQGFLILHREPSSTPLLGEINVAEYLAHRLYRRTQERMHRRVIGWESDGSGMVCDVRDPDWSWLANQEPEHAAPARRGSDEPPLLGRNSSRDKLHQLTRLSDDSQRSVAGVCNLGGQVDDPLQHDRKRKLGCESEPGLEEHILAIAAMGHRRRMYACRAGRRIGTIDPSGSGLLALVQPSERWKAVVMGTANGFKSILLATDGSPESSSAADAAISLALGSSAQVTVIHGWTLEVHHQHGYWDVEVRGEAERLVDAVVSRLRAAGVRSDRVISQADGKHVAAAVAVAASDFKADLVIVGSRGLSEWQSMFKHSVSHQLLSTLDCPLLVVRGRSLGADGGARRILLAIAGGDDIAPGVRAASAAAAAPGSKVLVVHVTQALTAEAVAYVEPDDEVAATMASTIKLLSDAEVTAEGVVTHSGPVALVIADIASRWQADLIVAGSSRMGNLAGLLLGSVSHDLLHVADRPVLIAARAGS